MSVTSVSDWHSGTWLQEGSAGSVCFSWWEELICRHHKWIVSLSFGRLYYFKSNITEKLYNKSFHRNLNWVLKEVGELSWSETDASIKYLLFLVSFNKPHFPSFIYVCELNIGYQTSKEVSPCDEVTASSEVSLKTTCHPSWLWSEFYTKVPKIDCPLEAG